MITQYFEKITQWIFPPTCILCQNPSNQVHDLCRRCLNDLPFLPAGCPYCAHPLTSPDLCCGSCLKNPPPFDALYALFAYQAPITHLMMTLKFHNKLLYAQILGELMAKTIQNHWYHNRSLPHVIIPVPLHPKRLQERGYNQSLEIARPIAKLLQLPIDTQSCSRIKHTDAQARLELKHRKHNVKNAFFIQGHKRGMSIAVIDDITTTGHTLAAFCLALKKAGASRIDVWCCAKTLKK